MSISTSVSTSGPSATYTQTQRQNTPLSVPFLRRRLAISAAAKITNTTGEPIWAEANNQAEFYHHARLQGLPVLLEVNTPVGRIDVIVLSSDRMAIIAAVECKRNGKQMRGDSSQIIRYKKLGVPVYGLNDWHRASALVSTIHARHAHDRGVSWLEVERIKPLVRQRQITRRLVNQNFNLD